MKALEIIGGLCALATVVLGWLYFARGLYGLAFYIGVGACIVLLAITAKQKHPLDYLWQVGTGVCVPLGHMAYNGNVTTAFVLILAFTGLSYAFSVNARMNHKNPGY